MPSRRRQISATAARFAASQRELRPRRHAPGRRRAGSPSDCGDARRRRPTRRVPTATATRTSCSPADPQALPARRQHPHLRAALEHASMRAAPRRRAGARSCRARPAPLGPQVLHDAVGHRHARRVGAPHARRRRPGPSASSSSAAASSQNHTPSGNRGSTSAATCNARRVLPTPPTPVNVTSRDARQHLRDRDTARRRAPRTTSPARGRFPGNASSDRNGGNSAGSPGAATWNTRSGRARSRSRCSPRSTSSTLVGSSSRTSSSVASDTTI